MASDPLGNLRAASEAAVRQVAESYAEREAVQRRTAGATAATSESLEEVVVALNASLEVARNAKADADGAQRISTGIAFGSLKVAVGSLAVAIVALAVTGV